MKNNNPAENNFGVPKVDYTPMGTIGMEGQMFRGMTDSRPKSLFVRLMTIAICLFIFLLPGLVYLIVFCMAIPSVFSEQFPDTLSMVITGAVSLFQLLLCLTFIAVGFFGIKANIKK